MLLVLILAFPLFSYALAYGPVKPVCTQTQFRNAALNLTLEYQNFITECDYSGARSLTSIIAVARVNQDDCLDRSCCQTIYTVDNFNELNFDNCRWTVYWINQTPMTAVINPCGDVSVFAVMVEEFKEDTEVVRAYQGEFIWRPKCGVTGCLTNCALELVEIKYATRNCTDWNATLCEDCPVKV